MHFMRLRYEGVSLPCSRLRLVLLAVMVTASHVALVSHVYAHFQPALEQCELCVSQAQPQAAVPAAEAVLEDMPAPAVRIPTTLPLPHVPPYDCSHCQRAPPLPSS